MSPTKKYSVAAVLAISLVTGAACTKKSETTAPATTTAQTTPAEPAGDTIRIGEVGSMTGSEATFGQSTHNGILLALKEINSKGGVKGKKLEVTSLDDQGKPEEA